MSFDELFSLRWLACLISRHCRGAPRRSPIHETFCGVTMHHSINTLPIPKIPACHTCSPNTLQARDSNATSHASCHRATQSTNHDKKALKSTRNCRISSCESWVGCWVLAQRDTSVTSSHETSPAALCGLEQPVAEGPHSGDLGQTKLFRGFETRFWVGVTFLVGFRGTRKKARVSRS